MDLYSDSKKSKCYLVLWQILVIRCSFHCRTFFLISFIPLDFLFRSTLSICKFEFNGNLQHLRSKFSNIACVNGYNVIKLSSTNKSFPTNQIVYTFAQFYLSLLHLCFLLKIGITLYLSHITNLISQVLL